MIAPRQECNIRWQVARSLHLRAWNEEFVAYHSLSGDTHLLGHAAGHILSELQQTPADAITLSLSLSAQLAIAPDEAFMSQIEKILADLDTLALIEPA